jgi:TatA/E family protein of Tat protein translocase
MGNLGLPEILLIAVIGLLVLGPKRLPEVARGLGQAVKSFQDALKGASKDEDNKDDAPKSSS